MNEFTSLTLAEFLDRTSDRTPTPGGGGVTAAAGALAAAMTRMVAAFSTGNKTPEEQRRRVGEFQGKFEKADAIMRRLIAEDASAFSGLQRAYREARQSPEAEATYQSALATAISVPLEMAGTASELLKTMDDFKDLASKHLLSDLGVAAVLADATVRAARFHVLVNVPELNNIKFADGSLDQINQMMTRSGQLCASVQAFVHTKLRNKILEKPCITR